MIIPEGSPSGEAQLAIEELASRFENFSAAFGTSAPLYAGFSARVAREPAILDLMMTADREQRIPVLLFACVHYLLLGEPDCELAGHYPNIGTAQSTQAIRSGRSDDTFVRFVLANHERLHLLLQSKSTQTNEIARCNWFLFPFAMIEEEVGIGRIARIDVGSSAGLTLLFSNVDFDVHPGRMVGSGGRLTLRCDTRGNPPLPDRVPTIAWSVGFDSSPVDLADEESVRWLEACVWPDQVDRFDRLVRAIDLARRHDVRVERGDAVVDLLDFVERALTHGHPVVTTSWVMNYLTPEERLAFVRLLDEVGSENDLSWVIAESPREAPELPVRGHMDEDITVISLVRWRDGRRDTKRLATAHPHGNWISWGT